MNQLRFKEVTTVAPQVMTKAQFIQSEHINYLSCRLVKDEAQEYITRKITSPDDVAKMATEIMNMSEKDIEEFWVLHLSSRTVVTALQMVSRGSLCETISHPREVFKAALLNNSCSIILVHNHPSGLSNPSGNDKKTTERLVEAGKIVGIKILDHVIIGHENNIFSFKENGLI